LKSNAARHIQTVRIRVPATSANLGPGFDALGLALNLFNEFRVAPAARNWIEGRGTCGGILGGGGIFFSAFRRAFKAADARAPKVEVTVEGRVPVARGLGSSATAIVAGVLAANAFLGSPFSVAELVSLAAQEEGHPDNVAPAILGGLVAAMMEDDRTLARRYRPHSRWRVALLIPEYPLSTDKARKAIPKKIAHRDAVFNLTRVPFVLDALVRGDGEQLSLAVRDRLHEPYRRKLIRGYAAIRESATKAGAAAVYLSGAGPTMAALCLGMAAAERAARAMRWAVRDEDFAVEAAILRLSLTGASVRIRKST
jgi:homoserine kinase